MLLAQGRGGAPGRGRVWPRVQLRQARAPPFVWYLLDVALEQSVGAENGAHWGLAPRSVARTVVCEDSSRGAGHPRFSRAAASCPHPPASRESSEFLGGAG